MNDFEVAEILLTQKKAKLAYPLAASYAVQLGSYEGYRIFVKKFPNAPQFPKMLVKAFEKAVEIDSEKAYDDFLGLVGKSSVLAFKAIGSEYTLFR